VQIPSLPALLILLVLAQPAAGWAGHPGESTWVRADLLRPLSPGPPLEVELWFPDRSGAPWPEPLLDSLREEIRATWPAAELYGPVENAIGLWIAPPLPVEARSGRVRVAVLEAESLPVQGRLELPRTRLPKRVVIAIDASQSANARTWFRLPDGALAQVSVLEAERHALAHLLDQLDDEWLELGLVAFGEQTHALAPPGASPAELHAALERFAHEHPEGEGRTDTICALWTAVDWLRSTPEGMEAEIVLLTDGDFPHSGRFLQCQSAPSSGARRACEERRNRTECPATRRLDRSGRSDLVHLARFGDDSRGRVRVSPLVFASDRTARVYRDLARRTGGQFAQIPSPQAIERALPALVARGVRGVFGRNLTTGARTGDLLDEKRERFSGMLPLAPGPNDIELRVESERGTAALYRARIFGAVGYQKSYLERLRARNRALEAELAERASDPPRERRRELEIELPANSEL
jgi:hypothetical protein